MTDAYPTREPFFAHDFCRLLGQSCAAQTIGPEGCWLLCVVAHTEDAVHYSGGVKFWNQQLMGACGFSSEGRLIRTRQRVIEAGWLHYEAGGKSRAGTYWVTIPSEWQSLFTSKMEAKAKGKRRESGGNVEVNPKGIRSANGSHSSLSPIHIPDPDPEERAPALIPAELSRLIDAWNELPEGIAPRVAKRDSKAILKAWKRACVDDEAGPILRDPERLMVHIKQAEFLHGQAWFRFPWLLTRDSGRFEWNCAKVVSGAYRENGRHKSERPLIDQKKLIEDAIASGKLKVPKC